MASFPKGSERPTAVSFKPSKTRHLPVGIVKQSVGGGDAEEEPREAGERCGRRRLLHEEAAEEAAVGLRFVTERAWRLRVRGAVGVLGSGGGWLEASSTSETPHCLASQRVWIER